MRIMIFGRPGSGKSTFAVELSQKTKLPLYHLDCYFYISNWIERDYDEFLAIQKTLVAQEHWIIDGNATRSLEMRYQRADIVLYFCYPRLLALWRIIKRRFFKKDPRIKDRAPGCSEKIDWKFIKYVWTFENRVKDKIAYLRSHYPHVKFYVIHNDHERDEIMQKLI